MADESLTFCSRYLKDFPTKFNVPLRNDETSADVNYEFSIFKKSGEPRGHYESINLSHEEYCQATMYVLQNCEEVWPFIEYANLTLREIVFVVIYIFLTCVKNI